jgi:hypothetical protein
MLRYDDIAQFAAYRAPRGVTPVDPCTGVICNPGHRCLNGICVGPCTGVICATGTTCREGICVQDAPGITQPAVAQPAPAPAAAPVPSGPFLGFRKPLLAAPVPSPAPAPAFPPSQPPTPVEISSPRAPQEAVSMPIPIPKGAEALPSDPTALRPFEVSSVQVPGITDQFAPIVVVPLPSPGSSPAPAEGTWVKPAKTGPRTYVQREEPVPSPTPSPDTYERDPLPQRPAAGGGGLALAALAGYFLFFR